MQITVVLGFDFDPANTILKKPSLDWKIYKIFKEINRSFLHGNLLRQAV